MFIPVTIRMGDGLTLYDRRLEGMAVRAADLTVPLTRIGADLKVGIGKQFASEGAYAYDWPYPHTTPWAALSDKSWSGYVGYRDTPTSKSEYRLVRWPGYRTRKEARYPGRPTLVASGKMRGAVLTGPIRITPHHLLYTPRDAMSARSYRYRWGHDPQTGERFLYPSPHTRLYDMAEIAYFHQVGAGHNPRRPMVAFPLSELREFDRVMLAWLNGREPLSTRLA